MRCSIGALFVISAFLLCGCNKGAESEPESAGDSSKANSDRGGVAVVDLDEIAKRLGRQVEMDDLLKRKQMELSRHLATVQASYEKQVDAKSKEYGETPNVDQIRVLSGIKRTAAIKYNQEQQKAAIDLRKFRVQLVQQLRAQVAPVAEKIARERGFDIVVPKDKALLVALNPAAEITEAVIERLLEGNPKPLTPKQTAAKPAEMPR